MLNKKINMKKMLLSLSLLMAISLTTIAQHSPKVKKEAAAKTKADGTPDLRFKENKEKKEVKSKGPLKADGTPDKRFKANKG
jgi:type II secretory pathway component PulC